MTATTDGAGPTRTALRRADGVELIGEMAGSGYRVPPSLVRRADGQTIQLTPLLYATLREIDGHRPPEEVAAAVSASTGRTVSEDNVLHFCDQQLRPLGLLVGVDGSEPTVAKRNPLLGLRFRYAVTEPDRTRRLTEPFRFLFRPVMVLPVLAAFAVVCWWVFFRKGLAAAAYDAFERPGLLILVFVVTVLSAGFHEFGHAAAARYGGATPGVMGFGLYLVWPAFYTDVTDSYRLGRAGRLRTDLGGLYFNAIVAVAITGVWLGLRYDALLLVVATQIIQMLRQLAPLVRFDGYHVLADLTGVPDLYGRIKPTLLGVLPWRWRDPQARALKPWARIVVTVWVLVVVPMLIASLAVAVYALPRLIGTAWASLNKQQDVFAAAWTDGDFIQAAARVLAMVAIAIPMAGIIYLLIRVVRQMVQGVRHATTGRPALRLLAVVCGAAVAAGVAVTWLDQENYRPIQASERGTIGDIAFALGVDRLGEPRTVTEAPQPVASTRLVPGGRGVIQALWDTSTPPPTQSSPQLAVILVPKAAPTAVESNGGGGYIANPAAAQAADEGWVFPVDKPLAPDPGDNQALAVNTTDGTMEYEAAFAMVYVEGSEAMNVNEAHAYASCNSCGAVAVAYQVVIVIDEDATDDNVAVPQNLAGALNYECVNCLTYALARQLFVTLDEPLSEDATAKIDAVWKRIQAYEAQIEKGKVDPDDIAPQLDAFTNEIKAIIEADQPGTFPSPTSTAPPTTTAPSTTVAATTSAPPPSTELTEPTATTGATAPTETAVDETATSAPAAPEDSATAEPATEAPTGAEDSSTDSTSDATQDGTGSDSSTSDAGGSGDTSGSTSG
ncbi:M50 family metallopeptidase [Mycobacterium sp. NPDC050041]|uniref:M50 family metallopeptidase n=1 Tax=Mycobacterium sp. NPDC050041 TaxID=3364293 RepID=UPI003C2EFACB